ncbi:MAG: NapC/NirT family cytochrome c [Candidatus Methanoperedens sp.]|nr:NapC/NirT family cytochrome c [Candidatus Methanoperedens sp.]MCZ7370160.1 NapC/NirT family cytochrome c [Candidatus Methanoperedens sp.]
MALRKLISITSLAILAIVIIAGSVGFQMVRSQPVFCNSCHEMNFYYKSWQSSTHGPKAVCLDCHSEHGLQGFIGENVRGAEQLAAHFSGIYNVPIKIVKRVKNEQCLACHPETRNLTDKTIEAKHSLHMDKSVLCADCHNRLVHNQSGQPRVMALAQCDLCHKVHANFKLLGVHATLNCEKCHPGDKYRGINPNCESCHKVPVNHIAGIVGNCDKCHSTAGWKPATFDHSKFLLTGKHQSLTCDQCHHGTYTGTATMCVSCHEPPSSHAGMDTDCAQCHSPDGFTPANFVHNRVGEHIGGRVERPLSCVTCHPVRFMETTCTGSRCHSSNNARGGDD